MFSLKKHAATFFVLLAFSITVQADVDPSQRVRDAISMQAQRAQQGVKDTAAFKADLGALARDGDPVAQFLLAALLMQEDHEAALKLLKASASKGCAGAAGILAVDSFAKQSGAAQQWLTQAVNGGDAPSMALISSFHLRGEHGYAKSIPKSAAWAKLARARAHSRPVSAYLEAFIRDRQNEMTHEQILESDALFKKLEKQYAAKPFYLCGQSTP